MLNSCFYLKWQTFPIYFLSLPFLIMPASCPWSICLYLPPPQRLLFFFAYSSDYPLSVHCSLALFFSTFSVAIENQLQFLVMKGGLFFLYAQGRKSQVFVFRLVSSKKDNYRTKKNHAHTHTHKNKKQHTPYCSV